TMDNATNNDTAVEGVARHLSRRGVTFDHHQQRLRCFSHVLNLAAQDVLSALPSPQDFDLCHVHDNVLKGMWREARDDATYMRALQSDLVARGQEISEDMFSEGDILALSNIRDLLSFFNAVQETLACEKTPTLPFVIPLYEQLLSLLKELRQKLPRLMHAIYAGIKKLEKYREECRKSDLYILAMVLNPNVKFQWIKETWEPSEAEVAKSTILKAVSKRTNIVQMAMHSPPPQPTVRSISASNPSRAILSERNINRNVKSLSTLAAKFQLRDNTPQADDPPAVGFGSSSASRFPRLFQLSMTILAVPATSVPSERVFSSSGRTDTAARNRLSPELMEALQILKFNRRNNVLDFGSAIRED
ncbi:hypothetical protein M408DRAFT_33590, partial [Serendipita vermifera MAFF 305830]